MHRSASNTRVSDEFSTSLPTQSSGGGIRSPVEDDSRAANHNRNQLPVYNPNSHAGKKGRSRLRLSENAVHFIPLVLVLCAIILWFCSNPVDMVNKDNSFVARVEGLKVVGGVDVDGTQSSLLPHLELDDLDLGGDKRERKPLG